MNNGYLQHAIKTSKPMETPKRKLTGLQLCIKTSKPMETPKGQLTGFYIPSLLRELNNKQSHIAYSKKKNSTSKNYGDPYGFPSNYPSKSEMLNSFAPVGVDLGPVNW